MRLLLLRGRLRFMLFLLGKHVAIQTAWRSMFGTRGWTMDKDYPVFVYLDDGEKVQIGVASANEESDFTIELTVPLYVEKEEDVILMDIEPRDIPDIDIKI